MISSPTPTHDEQDEEDFDDHESFNLPVLATKFLERLGYRLTDTGIVNEGIATKILAVEHEDGTPANFAFASNMQCTAGVVLPHPFQFYADWADDEDEDDEEDQDDGDDVE